MPLRLHVSPEAEEDLATAAVWYAEQDPERALDAEFLREFAELVERICKNPALFTVYDGSVRRALLQRFPYALYYEVESERIVVLALLHMKREPDSWRR